MANLRLKRLSSSNRAKFIETPSGVFNLQVDSKTNNKFVTYDDQLSAHLKGIFPSNDFIEENYIGNPRVNSSYDKNGIDTRGPDVLNTQIIQNKDFSIELTDPTLNFKTFRNSEGTYEIDNNGVTFYKKPALDISGNPIYDVSYFNSLSSTDFTLHNVEFNYAGETPLDLANYDYLSGIRYSDKFTLKNHLDQHWNLSGNIILDVLSGEVVSANLKHTRNYNKIGKNKNNIWLSYNPDKKYEADQTRLIGSQLLATSGTITPITSANKTGQVLAANSNFVFSSSPGLSSTLSGLNTFTLNQEFSGDSTGSGGVTTGAKQLDLQYNYLVVGTNGDSQNQRVEILKKINNEWILQQTINTPIPNIRFGECVSLDIVNNRLAVGAPLDYKGKVYLYKKINNTWSLEQIIEGVYNYSSDISINPSLFGRTIKLKNNHCLVGAGGADFSSFTSCGLIIDFILINNSWVQNRIITPSNLKNNLYFPSNFELTDSLELFAGNYEANNLSTNNGEISIFNYINDQWVETQVLSANPLYNTASSNFGFDISENNGYLGVTSYNLSGITHIYQKDLNTSMWVESQIISSNFLNRQSAAISLYNDKLIINTESNILSDDSIEIYKIINNSFTRIGEISGTSLQRLGVQTKLWENDFVLSEKNISGIPKVNMYTFDNVSITSGTLGNCNVFSLSGIDSNQNLTHYQILSSPNIKSGSLFGYSLAASDEFLFVGAPTYENNSVQPGAVLIFKYNTTNQLWEEYQILTSEEYMNDNDMFGSSIEVQNNEYLFVGAINDEDLKEIGTNKGAVHIYFNSNGTWIKQDIILGKNTDDKFGSEIKNGKLNEVFISAEQGDIGIYDYKWEDIQCGTNWSIGLLKSGKVLAWGSDVDMQANTGAYINFKIPQKPPFSHSFIQIKGGSDYSLALKTNGEVWTWGGNMYGQLGDNTIVDKDIPVSVLGNHSFIQIARGLFHSLALKSNGEVWAWGMNIYGQLGDNTTLQKNSPVSISGNHSFIQVAGGEYHSLALKANGEVWSWGWNNNGQLGDNTIVDKYSPISVSGNHSFIQIVGGKIHSLALKANGEVWTWGGNWYGQLGDNTILDKHSPVSVSGNHSFIQIAAGQHHSLALKSNGEVWAWGYNNKGQLGDNTTVLRKNPIPVSGNHSFIQIVGGRDHSLALKSNGEVWAWGYNLYSHLGDNTLVNKSVPVSVNGNHSFIQIVGGGDHSLALKSNGEVWTWGYNNKGQLGFNNNFILELPSETLLRDKKIKQILSNKVLDYNGEVWAWGSNNYGQLGNGSNSLFESLVKVIGNHSFVQIAGDSDHSLALKSNGEVWAWGVNWYGQLGDNTIIDKYSPISVSGNHSFIQIAGENNYSLALKSNGEVWAWGYNNNGQLGDNTANWRSSPVSVSGNHSFIQISGGQFHSLALKSNGEVWAWGRNTYGQLGDNTIVDKYSPVSVINSLSLNFKKIYTSSNTSIGITSNIEIYFWGQDLNDYFNNNPITNKLVPTKFNTSLKPYTLFFNTSFGFFIDSFSSSEPNFLISKGNLSGFGLNNNGQLGNGTMNNQYSSMIPVTGQISGFNNGAVYRYKKPFNSLDWLEMEQISGQYSSNGNFGSSIDYNDLNDTLVIADESQEVDKLFLGNFDLSGNKLYTYNIKGIFYIFKRNINTNFSNESILGTAATYSDSKINKVLITDKNEIFCSFNIYLASFLTPPTRGVVKIFNKLNPFNEWKLNETQFLVSPTSNTADFAFSLLKKGNLLLIGQPDLQIGATLNAGAIWVYYRNNKLFMIKQNETDEISKYDFIEKIKGLNRESSITNHKSNIYSIELNDTQLNEKISDVNIRNKIQTIINNSIKEQIEKISPTHTQLWDINWKGN